MHLVQKSFLPEGQVQVQHGLTIFAHEQTAGKGQRGKSWTSEKGSNIALSTILNPHPLRISDQFKLSVCSATSVWEFFSKYAGEETKIKWPNDLYWRDRKAGGVLIESLISSQESGVSSSQSTVHSPQPAANLPPPIQSNQYSSPDRSSEEKPATSLWKWAIVGIGININQTVFPTDLPNPVSLKQITGKNFEPVVLAKELCYFFENNFQLLLAGKFESLFAVYQTQLYKKNEKVKLKQGNRVFETTIKGISETGQLITQHSIEERFDFGEVEWMI